MAVDLSVALGPLSLRNPVIAASGTFGFGREYAEFFDLSAIGAVTTKAITVQPTEGNPPPRSIETPAGMLNSIGLQNPGIDAVLETQLPFLRQFDTKIIANIAGETIDDYVQLAGRLTDADAVDAIEVNISCPNVTAGGMQFGVKAALTEQLVGEVRAVTDLPLITKLSPNVTDILPIAGAAIGAGTDILSAINTLVGMSVDVEERRPHLSTVTGGLSGPAIRPIALRMVWQLANEFDAPIIGMGGIMTGDDALQFMLAGATAIGVGTANFVDPRACLQVLDGLEDHCRANSVSVLQSLVGSLEGRWG